MLPSIKVAEMELEIAETLNPGPWFKHSINVGIAARNIAEKIQNMDMEKAYILGILHDIGRRVGVVNISKHVYEGYKFCIEKGWNEVAKVCMTHSYILMQDEFDYEPIENEEMEIKKYILNCQTDDFDLLIQLCDSLAADYGFVIIEKRFVDVIRRYGIMQKYIEGWNKTFEIKEYFEEKMGCSVYDVLPNIGKTTLLSPPLWTQPVNKSIIR
ncbi:HD domain-containing protein [Anaerosacchariphilus polymeriproducens]|uniref:HDOD domain-containing protein n=1 Tax=Anaerosacchariphilus polymeriproducens TaxID=1812858 RepID=A0A371AQ93_9FIRM|nr:HD domain-containing protein [Anaerosacchariphilus polymeriproducens]RDU21753.1 HDOD domain-containing protein [Anaerosacchariphilus polymeriproducens]